ncbi:MAG: YitT family protein, partial [Candidatus Marinimicrobia bacterium]|nr:YitT family protein [Candidatus Neomarinimicrobiota bacterium]
MKLKIKTIVFEYIGLVIGSTIMSLGLVLFLIPGRIAPGGVSGIGIVLHYLFNLPVGLIMLLFNIPLFILGVKILGKQFGPRTFFSFIFVSLTTDFFDKILHLGAATENLLLTSIFGGILLGIGLGIVFRFKGTTGGSDIIGQIIHKYSNMTIGTSILFV